MNFQLKWLSPMIPSLPFENYCFVCRIEICRSPRKWIINCLYINFGLVMFIIYIKLLVGWLFIYYIYTIYKSEKSLYLKDNIIYRWVKVNLKEKNVAKNENRNFCYILRAHTMYVVHCTEKKNPKPRIKPEPSWWTSSTIIY